MSQEHIVRFKIQRMSFSHAPSFAVSLRSTQFRSISLCWKMLQISSMFLLAIHSHFILPHLASCHHPTKDTKTFPIPSHRSFFNVSPRVFCRRVITSACSFLLYLAQPVHPPFTLPSTCFTHSIQQFSTSHDVFGLQVTASPHPLVGTARFQEKKYEAQDLIMSTCRTEIRGNYGISDSLGWQSHFLRAEIEPMETCEMMIEDCGCENFQKSFCKLERGML